MRVKLTPAFVKNASAPTVGDRAVFWDEGMEGFALVVMASGHRSYVVQYRANGVSRRYTLDGKLSLSEARKKAKVIQGKVANGHDPVVERRRKKAEATNTLQAIGDEYLARVGKKLRSYKERKRILEKYVWPRLGSRQIDEIRRVEVIRLLDKVEDENGPVMADHVLAILRRLMSWHAARAEDFRTPLVKGMSRAVPARERARQRVLSDQELRAVWYAAETSGTAYGSLVQFILLTATRLREAAHMKRDELSVDGKEWVIPGSRHKSKKDFLVPLSQAARDVLAKLPVIGREGWIFTVGGKHAIGGFSKFKRQFDAEVCALLREEDPNAKPLPRWTNHDLRRTARSLMSRAGVSPDHAERALGHVISGVRGTYDRHEFKAEKAEAFEALALQIARILDPHHNVVALRDAG